MSGERLANGRASAVAVPQRHDLKVAGEHARDLDSHLIGFRAAVADKTLAYLAGRNLSQLFRQRNNCLVREHGGGVLNLVNLRLDLGSDTRVAVTDGDGHNAAEEIKV